MPVPGPGLTEISLSHLVQEIAVDMMELVYLGFRTLNHCLARTLEPSLPLLLAGRWAMGAGPLGARPGACGGDFQIPPLTPTSVW
jgi:hypothetical protein